MTSPKKLIILGTGGNSVDILDAVQLGKRKARSFSRFITLAG